VRPQIAAEVLPELRFRPDHHVVSLIAAVTLDFLRKVTAPAATVTRAVPLPPVARRQGPTTLYPPDEGVKALFDRLGVGIVLEEETSFDAFSSATAVMAAYFAFAHTVAAWMERNGVRGEQAHAFVRQMLEGLASAPAHQGFAELALEHQTKGGLNEQVFNAMTQDGIIPNLDKALDAILARLRAAPR
jgi:pyrroline-5-carboxylate reductase